MHLPSENPITKPTIHSLFVVGNTMNSSFSIPCCIEMIVLIVKHWKLNVWMTLVNCDKCCCWFLFKIGVIYCYVSIHDVITFYTRCVNRTKISIKLGILHVLPTGELFSTIYLIFQWLRYHTEVPYWGTILRCHTEVPYWDAILNKLVRLYHTIVPDYYKSSE